MRVFVKVLTVKNGEGEPIRDARWPKCFQICLYFFWKSGFFSIFDVNLHIGLWKSWSLQEQESSRQRTVFGAQVNRGWFCKSQFFCTNFGLNKFNENVVTVLQLIWKSSHWNASKPGERRREAWSGDQRWRWKVVSEDEERDGEGTRRRREEPEEVLRDVIYVQVRISRLMLFC